MEKIRSKKITIEDALVSVEEQPYEVPRNWCWTTLNQVCFFENGYAFKSDKFSDEGIPVIRISNISDNEVSIEGCVYTIEENIDDRFVVRNGDLLIAMSGATTGKNGIYLSNQKAYLNQRVGNIKIKNHDVLVEGYRNYYIASKQDEILRNAYGGAQPNISSTKIGKMLFPLPPFPEQQRIVEQIERLFSMLDEAKEKAQEVIDGFDSRRAAILTQAFSGKLTEKWRKEKNKEDVSWQMRELDSVCRSIFDGDHMPPPKTESGIPFIFISNVNTGQLSLEQTNYVSQEYYDQLTETRKPQKGDVLYTLVGSYGIAALVDTEQSFCFQRHMALLKPKPEKVLSRYLWYALQDKKVYDAATAIATGTAQLTVPIKGLRKIKIPVPSVEEQIKIAESLDTIFNLENKAKEEANKVIENIRNIKKAVLTKAFRGELGTQDSSDEPAEELLKRILTEAPVEEKKKSTTRKKKVKVVMNKDLLGKSLKNT